MVTETATALAAPMLHAVNGSKEGIVSGLPRYMHLLHIDDRQLRELAEILKATHEATQAVRTRAAEIGTRQAMQEIERVHDAAAEVVISVLTPAQAEQLRGHIARGRKSTSPKATVPFGAPPPVEP